MSTADKHPEFRMAAVMCRGGAEVIAAFAVKHGWRSNKSGYRLHRPGVPLAFVMSTDFHDCAAVLYLLADDAKMTPSAVMDEIERQQIQKAPDARPIRRI